MDSICEKINEKLASLAQEEVKTHEMTYIKMMLRSALIYAFKQPKANVEKIGDLLYHQYAHYIIACNGIRDLFSDAEMSNGKMRMFSDENHNLMFDKCFLFSQYCNSSKRYINDLFDCGMVSEAEDQFSVYLKFTLLSCSPYRLLNTINCFYLIRGLVEFKREDLNHIKDWIIELCSIKYGWILEQEQVYSRAIINESLQMRYTELLKLKKPISVEKFSYKEVITQLGMEKSKETPLLPIQLAENLMRATTYLLTNSKHRMQITKKKREEIGQTLMSCKRAETSCRSNWLMLKQLERLFIPPPQNSWFVLNALSTKNIPADKDINKAIMDAYSEYKSFQHLLYILWRRACGTYIAANIEKALQKHCPYDMAMLLSESMSISLRSATRMQETKLRFALKKKHNSKNQHGSPKNSSKESVFPLGYFDGIQSFKKIIKGFPSDTTVLQFSFDSNDVLWLVRYHRSHEPYAIPFCQLEEGSAKNELFVQLKKILEEDELIKKDIVETDYWNKRQKLNDEMKKLVLEMQKQFFGALWPLCQAFAPKVTESLKARKVKTEIQSAGFCSAAATILTQLLDHISNDEWNELINLMAERERSIKKEILDELKFSTLKIRIGSKKKSCEGDSYVFLVLPPSLSTAPWECMPVFENALVSRIPSIFTLKALLVKHIAMPKRINARNSYYVLNPNKDLIATQELFENLFSGIGWKGVAGDIPEKGEIIKALKSKDMYVFIGHGSGRKYIGTNLEFRNLDCRSVCLLMGCSTVEILNEGRNFDGRSIVYDFMLSCCPCLVGCLWKVTSGEIGRFFNELIGFCFKEPQLEPTEQKKNRKAAANSIGNCSSTPVKPKSKIKSSDDTCRFIIRGISKARTACNLPYLAGGAVVSYGLPTFTQY